MTQIKRSHIDFMSEATRAFAGNIIQESFRDDKKFPGFMALRMGYDRDCVEVYEHGERVANFVQMMEPKPYPQRTILTDFMFSVAETEKTTGTYHLFNDCKGDINAKIMIYSSKLNNLGLSKTKDDIEKRRVLLSEMVYMLAVLNDEYGR